MCLWTGGIVRSSAAFPPQGLPAPAIERLPTAAPFCPPLPPARSDVVRIKSGDVEALSRAVRSSAPGSTVVLEDGVYRIPPDQTIAVQVPNLTLRSASGHRDAVVLEGGVHNIYINNVSGVTVADVTLRQPRFHNVQVWGGGGVVGTRIYNVHALDAGQQLIKVNAGDGKTGKFADEGLIACSVLEYSSFSRGTEVSPPSYTNGIDILAGKAWVIRDNVLRRIRSESGPAGPAILVWRNSQETIISRNTLIDCWRGIALGLSPPDRISRGGDEVTYDHQNGLLDHNVVLALREPADAAIETNYARNSRIIHNTVYYTEGLKHAVSWSIEYRFPPTTVVIRNNLTNMPIRKRFPMPGREAVIEGNRTDAQARWFRDLRGEDIRLVPGAPPVDQGTSDTEVFLDIDGTKGTIGHAPDIGADEFEG